MLWDIILGFYGLLGGIDAFFIDCGTWMIDKWGKVFGMVGGWG
jgi:hypothetical protein